MCAYLELLKSLGYTHKIQFHVGFIRLIMVLSIFEDFFTKHVFLSVVLLDYKEYLKDKILSCKVYVLFLFLCIVCLLTVKEKLFVWYFYALTI